MAALLAHLPVVADSGPEYLCAGELQVSVQAELKRCQADLAAAQAARPTPGGAALDPDAQSHLRDMAAQLSDMKLVRPCSGLGVLAFFHRADCDLIAMFPLTLIHVPFSLVFS